MFLLDIISKITVIAILSAISIFACYIFLYEAKEFIEQKKMIDLLFIAMLSMLDFFIRLSILKIIFAPILVK